MIESTQELGNDLAGVMALQRKLTGMERDLAAIEDKLGVLSTEAERLAALHPEQAQGLRAQGGQLSTVWDEMKVPPPGCTPPYRVRPYGGTSLTRCLTLCLTLCLFPPPSVSSLLPLSLLPLSPLSPP